MKRYTTDSGEFSFDQIINGQTPLVYNDIMAQVATQRELRTDAILTYKKCGIEGLISQINDMLGDGDPEYRTVKASPYFWPEYTDDEVIYTTIKKTTAGSVNANVTAAIDLSSHSGNGRFSMPRKGFRAYIIELDRQAVDIFDVVKNPNFGHSTVLKPMPGESIDLSNYDYYTLLVDPLKNYVKGDTNDIETGGFVKNPPTIRKGYIQMFEKGYEVHQDELNGYVYDVDFRIGKGLDHTTQTEIEYYDFPVMNNKLLRDYMDSKIVNTLFNRRNDATEQGFEALVPSIKKEGAYSRFYDPASGSSLKSSIFNWVRQLRAREGATDNLLGHDFGWGLDWTQSIGQLVTDTKQQAVYELFGSGGTGVRDFTWYQFKDFHAFDYNFKTMRIDTFDKKRYGAPMKDTALLLPMTTYRDTKGRKVGPVSYVNIQAAENAPQKKMWLYDFRPQGKRTVKFYCQDTWGMEIHATQKMGIQQKQLCS